MNKIIILIAIVVVLLVAALGLYFFLMPNPDTNTNQPDNTSSTTTRTFVVEGMKVEVLREGNGAEAKAGDQITANYSGKLVDGTEFDSSYKSNKPYVFVIGEGKVLKGWDLGVRGMKVGEKRRLTMPPQLAYGAKGFLPIIPKNATLIYEVDLLKIGK